MIINTKIVLLHNTPKCLYLTVHDHETLLFTACLTVLQRMIVSVWAEILCDYLCVFVSIQCAIVAKEIYSVDLNFLFIENYTLFSAS